jgi:hypothetical protein
MSDQKSGSHGDQTSPGVVTPVASGSLPNTLADSFLREGQLKAALKWLLENQVYVSGGKFIEAGCGCCSSPAEAPPEIEKTIREAIS